MLYERLSPCRTDIKDEKSAVEETARKTSQTTPCDFFNKGAPVVDTLDELAHAIDNASDRGDEATLRRLGTECESQLRAAENEIRVRLLYYWANTYAGIISIKRNEPGYISNCNQPDSVREILLLRRAACEPSYKEINPVIACQIRTNLANRLQVVGRPIAANEERLRALTLIPHFAKALANQAQSTAFYARQLYDQNHIPLMLAAARSRYDAALSDDALWESGDRDSIAPSLLEERNWIAEVLKRNQYDENFATGRH